MIYLDTNATTPMKPAVRAAILEAMERYGNPSSVHRYGRIARRYVEEARASVAALVGARPAQVIFTSGGTEANALALRGLGSSAVIASAIEHQSVLAHASNTLRLPVNDNGVIDLVRAEKILADAPKKALVSVMLVNNETGVIQPVGEIARIARAYGHLVHTDAVQAAGRLPIDFADLGVDALTLSAHKIGGPQAVGTLIVNDKLPVQPIISGGGQEMNRRAGTENVPGIVGFGIAAKLAVDDLRDMPHLAQWRDRLQVLLKEQGGDDAVVIGGNMPRIGNTLCVAMRGVSSETQVMAMDLGGVAASAGAACSSGKVKTSHVLRAMGCADEIAGCALRLSLGWHNDETDILRAAEAWGEVYQRTRAHQSSRAA